MRAQRTLGTAGLLWGLAVSALLMAGCAPSAGDAGGGSVRSASPQVRVDSGSADPVELATPQPSVSPLVDPNSIPVQSGDLAALSFAEPLAPSRLVAADVGLDLRVVPEGVDADGNMALPTDLAEIGWYQYASGLDAERGAVVLAGHVDTLEGGVGPLVRLKQARPGQLVQVTGADGVQRSFVVTEVENIQKGERSLDSVFDAEGEYRLVIITCGGTFDRAARSYTENVVVTARPA